MTNETNEEDRDGAQREFEVTTIGASDTATSGEEANVVTVEAESEQEAEEKAKRKRGVVAVKPHLTVEIERDDDGRRIY